MAPQVTLDADRGHIVFPVDQQAVIPILHRNTTGGEQVDELAEFGLELQERYPGIENIPRWREEGRQFLATRMPVVPWTRIVDHIDHIVATVGVDHVGIGSDFDGAVMPEGMEDASKLPQITEELLRRGYSEPDIKKILGGNILRVMEDVAEASARLGQS